MAARKAIWVEWLAHFGSMVGMQCPDDLSDESLRHFYHQLCLKLHPDKVPPSADQVQKDRVEVLFKALSGINDTYTNTENDLEPPDDGVHVHHDRDSAPMTGPGAYRGRFVYLVTFSHPSGTERRAPSEFTRQGFAQLLLEALPASVPDLRIEYLAIFQEEHAPSSVGSERAVHFHASVKCDKQHQELHSVV